MKKHSKPISVPRGGYVGEHVLVLRCGVLRPVGCRHAQHHHHRLPGPLPLRPPEEAYAVVGNEVGQIVSMVVVAMPLERSVAAQRVVVELAVPYQPHPLSPPRRDPRAVILVQIFAKVACMMNKYIALILVPKSRNLLIWVPFDGQTDRFTDMYSLLNVVS